MRPGAGTLCVAAIVLVAADAAWVAAQGRLEAQRDVFSASSRVRCLDANARNLMERALAASSTVARQVAALQSTDLIVGIETTAVQKARGEARLLGATPETRLVRIRIRIPGSCRTLVSVLGHELRHALEIAAEPAVRDAATLRAYYLRIGYERARSGLYETAEAQEAGRRVAAEYATRVVRVSGR